MITHEEEHKGLRVRIMPDDDPESPRDWDNLGTMVCFHRRHNLGDKHDYNSDDYSSWDEMKAVIQKAEDPAAILPLYLMDHGGLCIRTHGFGDYDPQGWDWGQLGFIFVSKTRARKELGAKRLSRKALEEIKGWLEQEVKTYDQYLMGDVYGFVIDRPETCETCEHIEHEVEESVWGIYGHDACLTEARSAADHVAEYQGASNTGQETNRGGD